MQLLQSHDIAKVAGGDCEGQHSGGAPAGSWSGPSFADGSQNSLSIWGENAAHLLATGQSTAQDIGQWNSFISFLSVQSTYSLHASSGNLGDYSNVYQSSQAAADAFSDAGLTPDGQQGDGAPPGGGPSGDGDGGC